METVNPLEESPSSFAEQFVPSGRVQDVVAEPVSDDEGEDDDSGDSGCGSVDVDMADAEEEPAPTAAGLRLAERQAKRDREADDDTSDDEGLSLRAKPARTNPADDVGPASELFRSLKRKAKQAKLAKLPADRSGPH